MIRLAFCRRQHCAMVMVLLFACSPSAFCQISVSPASIELDGPESTVQLAVWKPLPGGRVLELTRMARYQIIDGNAAGIDANGLVQPKADGNATLEISHEPRSFLKACLP